ncbi:MAG: TetR/AcrR family transcriptional regulator [Acidimicrobiaceae bacterium]|nr:TetR/AcrR family transcriptional regulator [Acidimicrobiaceae bacterium]
MGRDEEILDAAERLFFERSFDGVGVDEIGRAAGVSGSAIYQHFHGKDELLAALFTRVVDTLLLRLGEPDPDPDVELDKLLRAFAELAIRNERLAAIWVREQRSLAEVYRRDHDRRQRYFTERWVACLRRHFPTLSEAELVSATRAVQMILLSEALRPPSGRHSENPQEILLSMAHASLQGLRVSTTSG